MTDLPDIPLGESAGDDAPDGDGDGGAEASGGADGRDGGDEPFGGGREGRESTGEDVPGGDPSESVGADASVDAGESSDVADDGDDVEPVEVLVQLAEDGEIDPWDIDIVDVTDAFLDELESRDLRTSGRALFYASVLLRMKSDALLGDEETEDADDEPEPWETAFRDDPAGGQQVADDFDPVDALEAEMDRRLERKSTRGSPETLDELVRELRDAERDSWWKKSREYDTSGDSGSPGSAQTLQYRGGSDPRPDDEPGAGDVTETTHEEDIETVIDEVQTTLSGHYERGRPEVLFREVRDTGGSPVRTYLALLFLAHRGAVELRQDDLFGDLWIRDPTAATASDEAVAD
ncbi:segregation/condensation protein A [Halobaculum sp. MBLA0147]|uniref:segregation/condensation protein A n=1 Tax=Halobaculum sp. MBLA0147 TaxID=3079934 RepID=UPI0035261F07